VNSDPVWLTNKSEENKTEVKKKVKTIQHFIFKLKRQLTKN